MLAKAVGCTLIAAAGGHGEAALGDAGNGEPGIDEGGLDVNDDDGLIGRFRIGFGTKFGSGMRCGLFKTLTA